jgi:hypothetical protein
MLKNVEDLWEFDKNRLLFLKETPEELDAKSWQNFDLSPLSECLENNPKGLVLPTPY